MENAADNNDPIARKIFDDLCQACRVGDLTDVQILAPQININQLDEWDYLPLILALLCGHLDIVKYLLGNGALCDKDTFEGERCVYGALNDLIRNTLLSYDMNISMEVANPFISHIIKLQRDDLDWVKLDSLNTKDVAFDFDDEESNSNDSKNEKINNLVNFRTSMKNENKVITAHKFILNTRSPYFARKFNCDWKNKLIIKANDIISDLAPKKFCTEFKYLINLIYLNFSSNKIDIFKLDYAILFELMDILELDISLLELVKLETSKNTFRKKSKLRNHARKNIFEACKKQFLDEYSNLIPLCLHTKTTISCDEKMKLLGSSYFDTIIYCLDEDLDQRCYFPVNKAMLLRASYYEVLFNAKFEESVHRQMNNKYRIVEQVIIGDNNSSDDELKNSICNSIPVIEVNLASKENTILFLHFLYGYDNLDFPLDAALEMLFFGHYLEFDALVAYSSKVLIGARVNRTEKLIEYDLQTLSYLLKASWTTSNERLKEFVSRSLTMKIAEYYNDPIFIDLVRESASMVKNRDEWDSIELIDEIRYYLENWKYPKYSMDIGENIALQKDLDILEKLLQQMGLEA